jgi:hypothetical protein
MIEAPSVRDSFTRVKFLVAAAGILHAVELGGRMERMESHCGGC